MTDEVYPVPREWAEKALINADSYAEMYRESVEDPDSFWRREAQRIDWIKPFTKVKNTSFKEPVSIKWYEDGTLNVSANCVDRHLAKRGDQVAILWEGDDPAKSRKLTYRRVDAYLTPMDVPMKSVGGSAPTRSFHRPLSDYVNGLAKYGFAIDAMREPGDLPEDERPGKRPARGKADIEIPLFLALRARRG